mmetsp:Transcript_53742/g.117264  ORF Transcript_53742/g.117264 Transcript_53742/m.117264 type:complete len:333 (-) Transcript_53742:1240-2238(-)
MRAGTRDHRQQPSRHLDGHLRLLSARRHQRGRRETRRLCQPVQALHKLRPLGARHHLRLRLLPRERAIPTVLQRRRLRALHDSRAGGQHPHIGHRCDRMGLRHRQVRRRHLELQPRPNRISPNDGQPEPILLLQQASRRHGQIVARILPRDEAAAGGRSSLADHRRHVARLAAKGRDEAQREMAARGALLQGPPHDKRCGPKQPDPIGEACRIRVHGAGCAQAERRRLRAQGEASARPALRRLRRRRHLQVQDQDDRRVMGRDRRHAAQGAAAVPCRRPHLLTRALYRRVHAERALAQVPRVAQISQDLVYVQRSEGVLAAQPAGRAEKACS